MSYSSGTTDRAENIARSITDESQQPWALSGVAETLAATNPDRAENIARSITVESQQPWALSGVAKALAATNPGRAENVARSITVESQQAYALGGVAEALAATDPEQAARLLTDAEKHRPLHHCRVLQGIGAERGREGAGLHILSLKSGRSAVRPRP